MSAPVESLRRTGGNLVFRLALGLIVVLVAVAILAPVLTPYDPNAIDLDHRLAGMSREHWLGTDHLGRDVLSRLLEGTRVSLGVVVVIAVLILGSGFVVGSLSGWVGGWLDSLVMRVCEAFMTFPTFILAMFLTGVLGRGMVNVVLAIVLTHWAWYARITRGMVQSLKNREFVLAAHLAGGGQLGVFFRHIASPVLGQMLILATLDLGHMMLHVSGLSFLGLGIQPPTAEWGVMINDARPHFWSNPWLIVMPGGMILLTVLAFNIPGDRLRDRLDPTLAEGRE